MNNSYLSKTELEIMQYFWSINGEATATNIREHFSNKNWSKQTTNTFLRRLIKAGYLKSRKPSMKKCYYSAATTEEEYNLLPARNIIKNIYAGSYCDFISALFNLNDSISKEEKKRLKKILDQFE